MYDLQLHAECIIIIQSWSNQGMSDWKASQSKEKVQLVIAGNQKILYSKKYTGCPLYV